jgi:hypothetical protein
MKTIFPLVALLAATSLCYAEEPASVTNKKIVDCTVAKVVMTEKYESLQRINALYPSIRLLLTEMQALAAKAHDPKRPVGEQLSGQDNEHFGELRSRLMALQWRNLIESRHSKHMELIEKMGESVDLDYRWGRAPDEKSPYYMVDVTPDMLQRISPINTFNTPKENHCTLLWALHLLEQPSIAAVFANEVDTATGQINQLRQKYHIVDRINRNALSPDDQRVLDGAEGTLVRIVRDGAHVEKIEQIKSMAEAADMIYTAGMKDVEQSAGDPNSPINTLQQMKKERKLSDQMETRIIVWEKLDEKYPSAEAIGLQKSAKAMSAAPDK